jgi:hypothetical protein
MTKEEIMDQVEEMLPDVIEHIKKKCVSYLLSGMLDYENDLSGRYYTSKTCLSAALKDCAEQYAFNWMEEDLKNLEKI